MNNTIDSALTASQLSDMLDGLRDAHASLRGCLPAERANEVRILTVALREVCSARLARRCDRLSDRRSLLIRACTDIIAETGIGPGRTAGGEG